MTAVKQTLIILTLATGAGTTRANMTTIDPPPNAIRLLTAYNDGGLSLSTPDGFWISTPTNGGGSAWYAGSNPYYLGQTAFDAAAIHNPDPTITLTYQGGNSPFDLIAIDLAPESIWQPVLPTVRFVGIHPDGSRTTDTVSLSLTDQFKTYALPGMSNIVSLSWAQGPWNMQFTNIDVQSTPAITSVPELSSLTMTAIVTAMVGVVFSARHHRRASLARLPHSCGDASDS